MSVTRRLLSLFALAALLPPATAAAQATGSITAANGATFAVTAFAPAVVTCDLSTAAGPDNLRAFGIWYSVGGSGVQPLPIPDDASYNGNVAVFNYTPPEIGVSVRVTIDDPPSREADSVLMRIELQGFLTASNPTEVRFYVVLDPDVAGTPSDDTAFREDTNPGLTLIRFVNADPGPQLPRSVQFGGSTDIFQAANNPQLETLLNAGGAVDLDGTGLPYRGPNATAGVQLSQTVMGSPPIGLATVFETVTVTVKEPKNYCGDGLRLEGEACDDGFTDECGTCNADCTGPGTGSTCGDGFACRQTEVCDDGFTDACGACNADCSGLGTLDRGVCGDGEVCGLTEVCDDGFTDACGTCNADCTDRGTGSTCGDGAVCPEDEACDDGFTDACGTCNADCSAAGAASVCGDGAVCPEDETCDDGFTDACGTCNGDCSAAGAASVCGDGAICPEDEACDDGFTDACGTCNADCSAAGAASVCGDGAVCPEDEACDDGNMSSGDGCSSVCALDMATSDAGPMVGADAGPMVGADAGPMTGMDAGPMGDVDAGSTSGADAGSTSGADAGSTSGADAGSTSGADAGSTSGADAGPMSGADAGTSAGGSMCAARPGRRGANGAGVALALGALVLARRRRSRG